MPLVTFEGAQEAVRVPPGTLITDAARLAGVEIAQPCGGQGRCGRCAVLIQSGAVRRRSTLRLSAGRYRGRVCAGLPDRDRRRCVDQCPAAGQNRAPPDNGSHRRRNQSSGDYDPATMQPIRRVTLTLPRRAWTIKPTIGAACKPRCASKPRIADWQVSLLCSCGGSALCCVRGIGTLQR